MPAILITGASQGIGAAIAEAFAVELDMHLALVARSGDKLDAVADRCRALGAAVHVLPCDVTSDADVADLAAVVASTLGPLDVLVNNAGAFTPAPLLETDAAAFRAQIDANLTSAFLVTQAFLPAMLARGRGTLFFMASVASLRAYPGSVAYCAAKHGLLGLARVVREETRGTGVRVTTLLPGATLTPSWEGVDLPAERFIPPEDIARTVVDVWKLSDRTVIEEIVIRPQQGDV